MKLTPYEQEILTGKDGAACQRAMEVLVLYGEALGAERLVPTSNVCGGIPGGLPLVRDITKKCASMDEVFSIINLDSDETLEIPPVKAFSCRLIQGMDPDYWDIQGLSPESRDINLRLAEFSKRIGFQLINTCAPYHAGNVPIMGEHCAWMESSAVVLCNSVFGARTNTEGTVSVGAAMLVERIPYWGLHLDENRKGNHLVQLELQPASIKDWGILGYFMGEALFEKIPVLTGLKASCALPELKHMGAAAASSGGIEMYHLVGVTPEAPTLEAALGRSKKPETLVFDQAARKATLEHLIAASSHEVDFVVLGCPHYSLEQVWRAARLLEGKKLHPNVRLWIFTARATKKVAQRMGLVEIIEKAGGLLMTDTCPAIGRVKPEGAKVAVVDSAKQAHYLPPALGVETWFGSMEECIQAALEGRFSGELS